MLLVGSALLLSGCVQANKMIKTDAPVVTRATLSDWLADSEKSFLIVDVRPESVYNKKHVAGALNTEFSASATADQKEEFTFMLGDNKARTFVLYAGSSSDYSAAAAANFAKSMGFTEIFYFAGGLESWDAAGLKTQFIEE